MAQISPQQLPILKVEASRPIAGNFWTTSRHINALYVTKPSLTTDADALVILYRRDAALPNNWHRAATKATLDWGSSCAS